MPSNKKNFLEITLSLLIYLDQKGGEASLDEVKRLFGLDSKQLKKIARKVSLSGIPPFTPSDLFYLEINDRENKVILTAPIDVRVPFALEAREVFEFLFALLTFEEYFMGASERYRDLVEKIKRSLPNLLVKAVQKELEVHKPLFTDKNIRFLAGLLSDAAKDRKKVRFVYYPVASGQLKEYTVFPLKVVYHMKAFYLWAVDEDDGTVKSFLLDNIGRVTVTPYRFQLMREYLQEQRKKEEEFVHHKNLPRVTLKAFGYAARYIDEIYMDLERRWLSDDELLIEVPLLSIEWLLSRWILPYAGKIEIVEPEEVKQKLKELIDGLIEKFRC